MEFQLEEKRLVLFVEKTLYSEDVLFKCFYWYGNNYSVKISEHENSSFCVVIELLPSAPVEFDSKALCEKVLRDLNDFKLRDIVSKETQNIRELLVAKAFAYYETEGDPLTDASDPVGFTPQML
jgi:His-Xaa-Ser system protein HxsD